MMKEDFKLYLKSLTLQNFATFENQTIQFNRDFNAIIGETGSGKSLILDALQMIFGSRAEKKTIRKGCDFSTIEASFELSNSELKAYFDSIGYPIENNEVLIKRIIYSSGSSKSFLNYQTCPLSTLQTFSKNFIDLVGQFENQKLLSEEYQLILLDSFSSLESEVKKCQDVFNSLQVSKKKLDSLKEDKANRDQRIDYLNFQISEIKKLSPSVEEELELSKRKEEILSLQKNQTLINQLMQYLSEAESGNVLQALSNSIKLVEQVSEAFPKVISDKLYEAQQLLEDASFDISKLQNNDDNIEELENIIDRLDLYQKLKRKFGGDTQTIIAAYDKFQSELDNLKEIDISLQQTLKDISLLQIEAQKLAEQLHKKRVKAALNLSSKLTESIRQLKMDGASLDIQVNKSDQLSSYGHSQVAFMAETNPGEGFYRVKDIASGGELSRILLSLRQILSSNDSISVFLFDEIDTGIGGETALKIGQALKKVAFNSQVIAITHLPQIAHYAEKLINVSKQSVSDNSEKTRTISIISEAIGSKRDGYIKAMTALQ